MENKREKPSSTVFHDDLNEKAESVEVAFAGEQQEEEEEEEDDDFDVFDGDCYRKNSTSTDGDLDFTSEDNMFVNHSAENQSRYSPASSFNVTSSAISSCESSGSGAGGFNSRNPNVGGEPTCVELTWQHGHNFSKKNFHKPISCHFCSELLWGLMGHGYICEGCNFIVHDKCINLVTLPCITIAPALVKNPVAHIWSERTLIKRKFCNVCRKKMEDVMGMYCQVCDYYVHQGCQGSSVANCLESATYDPALDSSPLTPSLSSETTRHHFQEGNLPPNSKCVKCRKTCWSAECLTGMRCQWCGITFHSSCLSQLNVSLMECHFGVLQPIFLPPNAISIPRSQISQHIMTPKEGSGISRNHHFLHTPLPISTSDEWSSCGGGGGLSSFLEAGSIDGECPSNASVSTLTPSLEQQKVWREKRDKERAKERAKVEKEKERGECENETIKVYDGYTALCERKFRTISVNKNCTKGELLSIAMKAFMVCQDPRNFYVLDVYANCQGSTSSSGNSMKQSNQQQQYEKEDEEVKDPAPVLKLKRLEGRRPAILIGLRENDSDCGMIRVWSRGIKVNHNLSPTTLDSSSNIFSSSPSGYNNQYSPPPVVVSCTTVSNSLPISINVSSSVTAQQVIYEALRRFKVEQVSTASEIYECDDGQLENPYRLVKVTVEGGKVTESVLGKDDIPWEILKRRGHESVRLMEMTRFYLEHKKDPHGPDVPIFIGNMPHNLSQKKYEAIIMKFLDEESKFISVGPIYYEYGSMVITYDDSESALKAYESLQNVKYDDKKLQVMLLPTVKPEMIPSSICPLFVFVNGKSGGGQGLQLISYFRKLLNPHQVFDLANGGPLCGLYVFRKIEKYKIMVCGGDGTVGWVLQCLDNVGQDSLCSSPPCAIVPLGTGNDLARVLRWGSGYTQNEEPVTMLKDIIEAEEIKLDRWTVVFRPYNNDDSEGAFSGGKYLPPTNAQISEDNAQIFVMNNYLGIGIEAEVCLDFHNKREEKPEKFNSRIHNKGVYAKISLGKLVGRQKMCKNLHKELKLEVDGKHVELPNIEGIIILNIMSWGSGAAPWGPEKDDKFVKPNHWDGLLEVVGVTGVVHLGQIQSGLRSAIRIVQGSHIKIRVNSEIPVHVDGEPWIQEPGDIVVIKSALKATMLKKRKLKVKRRNTEPSVNQDEPSNSSTVQPKNNQNVASSQTTNAPSSNQSSQSTNTSSAQNTSSSTKVQTNENKNIITKNVQKNKTTEHLTNALETDTGAVAHGSSTTNFNLVDICNSPSHATAV